MFNKVERSSISNESKIVWYAKLVAFADRANKDLEDLNNFDDLIGSVEQSIKEMVAFTKLNDIKYKEILFNKAAKSKLKKQLDEIKSGVSSISESTFTRAIDSNDVIKNVNKLLSELVQKNISLFNSEKTEVSKGKFKIFAGELILINEMLTLKLKELSKLETESESKSELQQKTVTISHQRDPLL